MNQKKNKLIIIAIIIVSILILGIGIIIVVSTDTFKSNKKLFLKYGTQIFDTKKGFINSEVIEYFKKEKNTPFETNGDMSFNITNPNIDEDLTQTNKCKITYSGQVDLSSSKMLENIEINYAEDVKIPFVFEKSNNTIGIQTEYIGSKFVGVELDKLSNIDRSLDNIDLNIEKAEITTEQYQYLITTYLKIVNEKLTDNNFSKVSESDLKGYKVALTQEELKQIIISLLEKTKDDQAILNIFNQFTKIESDDINDLIDELNSETADDESNVEITIFVNKNKVQKIRFETEGIKVELKKEESGNTKQYNIDFEYTKDDNTMKMYFIAKYSGLQSLQLITENYEFSVEYNDSQYVYYLNNEVNFSDDVSISDLNNSNCLFINRLGAEQVEVLTNAISERLTEVNRLQMERLGLTEDKNPLLYIIPSFGRYSTSSNTLNRYSQFSSEMSEVEVNTFNSKFEMYEDSNSQGTTTKGLLSTILNNNEQNQDDENMQIMEINFNGEEYEATEENITLIKSEIGTEDHYKVEFEKDENTGKIYRVVINKK